MVDLSSYNPEGSDLRRAQKRMLEILDVLDRICRQHNINYYLCAGTALGARRHGGFIPWDDDLDVIVLWKDYKKLITILQKELPENLKLQTRETDKNYWYYWAKIRDTRSRYFEERNEGYDFRYNGIFIDIFPLEPVPSLKFQRIVYKYLYFVNTVTFNSRKSLLQKVKYILCYCFLPFFHVLIYFIRLYYKFNTSKTNAFSYGIPFCTNHKMENFTKVGEITFEGKKYMAPSNVDEYLSDTYGKNFMEIPPENKRKTHSYKIDVFEV